MVRGATRPLRVTGVAQNRYRVRREHLEKVLNVLPRKWLKSRPESGLDWLMCAEFARQREGSRTSWLTTKMNEITTPKMEGQICEAHSAACWGFTGRDSSATLEGLPGARGHGGSLVGFSRPVHSIFAPDLQ